jgi:hypothetical protein
MRPSMPGVLAIRSEPKAPEVEGPLAGARSGGVGGEVPDEEVLSAIARVPTHFAGHRLRPAADFTPTEPLPSDPATERFLNDMAARMKQRNHFGAPPLEVFRNQGGGLEVIDGHHRLEAARRAGVDVFWVDAPPATAQLWLNLKGRAAEFADWQLRVGGNP